MKKLTLDILDSITPEYNQYQSIRPLTARLNEYTSNFFLDNQSWNLHFAELSNVNFNWQQLKYSEVADKKIQISKIVPDSIGVYLFMVKPENLIFDSPKYIFYVGIAGANKGGITGNRTLKDRLQDYFANSHLKKRDSVRIMIYKHYANIHIAYSPIVLPQNKSLEDIEKSLIGYFGTHILANKDDVPVNLKAQAKAFNI